jgi:hypothetical protein
VIYPGTAHGISGTDTVATLLGAVKAGIGVDNRPTNHVGAVAYRCRKEVTLPFERSATGKAWGRGAETTGLARQVLDSYTDAFMGTQECRVVGESSNTITLETYVYHFFDTPSVDYWFPVAPGEIDWSYAICEVAGKDSMGAADVADEIGGGGAIDLRVAPNPTGGQMRFRIAEKSGCGWRLRVYDMRGRLVHAVDGAPTSNGLQGVEWNGESGGRKVGSGVYFARLEAGGGSVVRKFMMVR